MQWGQQGETATETFCWSNHKRIKKKIKKKEKNNAEEIGEVNFISILIETRVTILRLREVLKLLNHFSFFFFIFGENVFIASSGDEVNT